MVAKKRTTKRKKKSGIIYFAVNNRIPDIVKIGMTIDSAERRLELANRKNEFMCGRWSITQKVKTNDVKRTEALAHMLFENYHDTESVSTEMYFMPTEITLKQMADLVREKDGVYRQQMEKEENAKAEILAAKKKFETLQQKNKKELVKNIPVLDAPEENKGSML